MILECPSCSTRYLVQIGLFAQGGRQVRCARCKHEWHATLPNAIDVVLPPSDFAPVQAATSGASSSSLSPRPSSPTGKTDSADKPPANLPAVIRKRLFPKRKWFILGGALLAAVLVFGSIAERQPLVKVLPALRGFYDAIGLSDAPPWEGLLFTDVRSELKYDSGMMKLYVDGVIRNPTPEAKTIPDIKAHALGPDRHEIQSWWVDAPAATINPGGNVPFHTEVASPVEHAIENVFLEFTSREEK